MAVLGLPAGHNDGKTTQVQVMDEITHPPKYHSLARVDRQMGSSPPAVKLLQ
jgi:hypothetical protein